MGLHSSPQQMGKINFTKLLQLGGGGSFEPLFQDPPPSGRCSREEPKAGPVWGG